MSDWIRAQAEVIGHRAPRELEALVAVSSPSGDMHGAQEAAAVSAALAPDEVLALVGRGLRRQEAA